MDLLIQTKSQFIQRFLRPISNISDSGNIRLQNGNAACLVATQDSSVILFGQAKLDIEVDTPIVLNCPDLKRFERILNLLENEIIELSYRDNALYYNDGSRRFTYHLLENGIINGPNLNIDKINSLQFDTEFTLKGTVLSELIKGSCFASNAPKLYISTDETGVYGELADRSNPLVDTYRTQLASEMTGSMLESEIPILFETIKILYAVKFEQVQVRINLQRGVVVFDIDEDDYKLKYIVSALVS